MDVARARDVRHPVTGGVLAALSLLSLSLCLGCNQSRANDTAHVSAAARMCGERQAELAVGLDRALEALHSHGLRDSRGALAESLETVKAYARSRHQNVAVTRS